jgi:hypothetical protein
MRIPDQLGLLSPYGIKALGWPGSSRIDSSAEPQSKQIRLHCCAVKRPGLRQGRAAIGAPCSHLGPVWLTDLSNSKDFSDETAAGTQETTAQQP